MPRLMVVISGESIGQGMNSPKNIDLDLLIDGFPRNSVGWWAFVIFRTPENESANANQLALA
jgi:hypothetical protein